MKNWNATHTKELLTWFSPDTYRKFEDLPLILLYHELQARSFFKTPLEGNEAFFVTINRKKFTAVTRFWFLRSDWAIWTHSTGSFSLLIWSCQKLTGLRC
jgi:hypothetical protein